MIAAAHVAPIVTDALPGPAALDPATPLTLVNGRPVTLRTLFGDHDALLLLHLGPSRDAPLDGAAALVADVLDVLAPHLARHAAVVVAAPDDPGRLADVAAARRWSRAALASTQPGDLTAAVGSCAVGGPASVLVVLTRTTGWLRVRSRSVLSPFGAVTGAGPGSR